MSIAIGILQGRLTPSLGRGIQFFPQGEGEWEKEFESAEAIGLSSIELLLRPDSLRTHPLMTPEGRKCMQELSQQNSISTPSVHAYYSKEDSYAQDLVDMVHAAAEVGASVILISFFHEKKLSPQPDSTWKKVYELLAPAAAVAKEKGIRFGIEAELPAHTLLEFISGASTPEAFGVYYDLGNQFACGFPVVQEICELKDKIVGVHIKDRLPVSKEGVESPTVPLGEGCADFKSAFGALKEIGYARPLILQGARGEDGDELRRNKGYKTFIERIAQEVWTN